MTQGQSPEFQTINEMSGIDRRLLAMERNKSARGLDPLNPGYYKSQHIADASLPVVTHPPTLGT